MGSENKHLMERPLHMVRLARVLLIASPILSVMAADLHGSTAASYDRERFLQELS